MTCPALMVVEKSGGLIVDLEGLLQEAAKARARELPLGLDEEIRQSLVCPGFYPHLMSRRRITEAPITPGGSRANHRKIRYPRSTYSPYYNKALFY